MDILHKINSKNVQLLFIRNLVKANTMWRQDEGDITCTDTAFVVVHQELLGFLPFLFTLVTRYNSEIQ